MVVACYLGSLEPGKHSSESDFDSGGRLNSALELVKIGQTSSRRIRANWRGLSTGDAASGECHTWI